jgi:NADH dehydrogenase/NADH:ubiquinone oxidoreductase subunit G
MPDARIQVTIDGRDLTTAPETTILSAAKSAGIRIPTLCHHEGLPPEGGCRLCLAELLDPGAGTEPGPGKLVASCLYPLRQNGWRVFTDSPKVRAARAYVLELLVNRCPASPRLAALAREYGVEPDPRLAGDGDLCIRCGRCARACAANGPSAISLVGRGRERQVTGPFFRPPEDCVGCLACAGVCPTGKITYRESGGRRFIWGREFELVRCDVCGEPFATREQLQWAGQETGQCERCRRRTAADSLRRALEHQTI